MGVVMAHGQYINLQDNTLVVLTENRQIVRAYYCDNSGLIKKTIKDPAKAQKIWQSTLEDCEEDPNTIDDQFKKMLEDRNPQLAKQEAEKDFSDQE